MASFRRLQSIRQQNSFRLQQCVYPLFYLRLFILLQKTYRHGCTKALIVLLQRRGHSFMPLAQFSLLPTKLVITSMPKCWWCSRSGLALLNAYGATFQQKRSCFYMNCSWNATCLLQAFPHLRVSMTLNNAVIWNTHGQSILTQIISVCLCIVILLYRFWDRLKKFSCCLKCLLHFATFVTSIRLRVSQINFVHICCDLFFHVAARFNNSLCVTANALIKLATCYPACKHVIS